MKKKDLLKAAGLSSTTVTKLSNHENVSMDVLIKICSALNCNIGDIVEIVVEDKNNE